MTLFDTHPIAVTVAGALLFGVVAAQVGLAAPVGEEWQHALGHAGPGISAAFLTVAVRRLWPTPPDTPGRAARTVLAIGLVFFALGQIVEAAGGFGYKGNTRVSGWARLHDVGVLLSSVALLVVLAGVAWGIFVAVARRRGALKPSTLKAAVLVAVAAAVAYVVAGIVLGF